MMQGAGDSSHVLIGMLSDRAVVGASRVPSCNWERFDFGALRIGK